MHNNNIRLKSATETRNLKQEIDKQEIDFKNKI